MVNKKILRKKLTMGIAGMAIGLVLGGCGGASASAEGFDSSQVIAVVSREDGSGTRGAFIELFDILEKGEDGSKKDLTTKEAIIAKQTDIMMTTVAGNPYAIGYISTGSVNDTIKAMQIDGVDPTAENIQSGAYPIYRPFHIATLGAPEGLAQDFISFILSEEGQAIVSDSYIPVSENGAYAPAGEQGKLVVAGSSSVSPLMEKLIEAYTQRNPQAEIELQTNDSSTGMQAAMEGTADIGMASRELKDSEKESLEYLEIALDGIALIGNLENPTDSLSKEQVKSIFTGELQTWSQLENE